MDTKAKLKLAIIEYQTVSSHLAADVDSIHEEYTKTSSQTVARGLIRTIFAEIEGLTFCLKQWALSNYSMSRLKPEPGELGLLEEVDYGIDRNGKITKRSARIRVSANIRFAFEAMARSHGIPFKFGADELGWMALNDAVAVRHRLMHPKTSNDLRVEDDEVVVALAGVEWFRHHSMGLLIATVRSYGSRDPLLDTFEKEWKDKSGKLKQSLLASQSAKSKRV